jgi:hypothetical protein
MNNWLQFCARHGAILFAAGIFVTLGAVASFQRLRQAHTNKRWWVGFAGLTLALGFALLLFGGFGTWLKGSRWYTKRLVRNGDIDGAIEMLTDPEKCEVVLDEMIQFGCTDFTRLIDKTLDTPYWFEVYQAQVRKDANRAIDYAMACPDRRVQRLLFDAIMGKMREIRIDDDYLIENRPDFFAQFLAGYQSDASVDVDMRLYSCALRSAMRLDRVALTRTLLARISNEAWQLHVLTTLGTTLARGEDIDSASEILSQAALLAQTNKDESQWLYNMSIIASTAEGAGLVSERVFFEKNDILGSLKRCAEKRESIQTPQNWVTNLAREFHLYRYLGAPDDASRTIADAREYINSIADPTRKKQLIDAWAEYQQRPAAQKIPTFDPAN